MSTQFSELKSAAIRWHNIIITGQAGTGKSCMLKRLKEELERDRVVYLTATTGIASSVLGEGARTVHSFFGLKDGRYTDAQLVENILDDNNINTKNKILSANTVLIDEVSMLSLKLLKQIDFLLKTLKKCKSPFGGTQIILSGDFFQLKPVPSPQYGDNEESILQGLRRFHHFQLTTVHRQSEELLIRAVHLVSRGEIANDVKDFLIRMRRKLPPGNQPVKLYAENYDVDVYNAQCLLAAEGPMKTYSSVDTGDLTKIDCCAAPKRVCFKRECPVILTVNISQELVNGLRGIVRVLNEKSVTVCFESIGLREITSYTFSVYDKEQGRDVAFRKQIPLKAAFALTVHKCQGLTLDRVEIDCRHMRNPGQLGVALGRVQYAKGLRVINFSEMIVRPHPPEVNDFYKKVFLPLVDDLSCCKQKPVDNFADEGPDLNDDHYRLDYYDNNGGDDDNDDDDDDESLNEDLNDIKVLDELFQDWNDDTCQEDATSVPFDLDIDVDNLIYSDPKTEQQKAINICFNYVKKNCVALQKFCHNIYSELNNAFDRLPEKLENKHFTGLYSRLALFMTGPRYKCLVQRLFSVSSSTEEQYRAAFYFVEIVREQFLKYKCKPIIDKAKEEASSASNKTYKESKGNCAKVRYIGGWCIAKLMQARKRKVLRNLYEANTLRGYVNTCTAEVRLLDQLADRDCNLRERSSDLASLFEVQRKQNARNGLLNISDAAFYFFLMLDKLLAQIETLNNLHLYGKSFYDRVKEQLCGSTELLSCWKQQFRNEDDFIISSKDCEDIIVGLFNEVLSKYIRMSSSQFRREYKKELHVEKEEAHRKQIRIRQKRKGDNENDRDGEHMKMSNKKNGKDGEQVKKGKKVTKLSERVPIQQDFVDKSKCCSGNDKAIEEDHQVKKKRKVRKLKASTSRVVDKVCILCEQECIYDSVCCDLCDQWIHFACIGNTGEEEEFIGDWYCPACVNS